jgi:hypothetical protein
VRYNNAKTSQTAEQKGISPYLNNVQGKKQGNEEDKTLVNTLLQECQL